MASPVRNPARSTSPEVVIPRSGLPPAHLLTVVTRTLSSSTVVCAVSGEVDLWTAPHLRDRLVEQIRMAGPDLVADLGGVGFLGAAGLTVLVEVRSAAEASGVRFSLVARTRPVLRPLAVTGLHLVFDVYTHVDGVPGRGELQDPRLSRS
ncbi:anti-anti-sigma factor [Saccharothrix carnea]|uniref:Anti-sigma factor antagonist n=1 Tax=Saccharothrix carnea TaxID=1280637 RepID=A0A2P8IEY0_SACCR|nr:STAS domain-containing protein [Saccharothrix carnea]PSL57025.1 anti-anti-sigma factor [Saccharothrix carnea]